MSESIKTRPAFSLFQLVVQLMFLQGIQYNWNEKKGNSLQAEWLLESISKRSKGIRPKFCFSLQSCLSARHPLHKTSVMGGWRRRRQVEDGVRGVKVFTHSYADAWYEWHDMSSSRTVLEVVVFFVSWPWSSASPSLLQQKAYGMFLPLDFYLCKY